MSPIGPTHLFTAFSNPSEPPLSSTRAHLHYFFIIDFLIKNIQMLPASNASSFEGLKNEYILSQSRQSHAITHNVIEICHPGLLWNAVQFKAALTQSCLIEWFGFMTRYQYSRYRLNHRIFEAILIGMSYVNNSYHSRFFQQLPHQMAA